VGVGGKEVGFSRHHLEQYRGVVGKHMLLTQKGGKKVRHPKLYSTRELLKIEERGTDTTVGNRLGN